MSRKATTAATLATTTCFVDALDAFITSNSIRDEGSPDIEQDEANLRNRLLFRQHGHIPEYAWFRATDIDRDGGIAARVKWWSTFGIYPHNFEAGFDRLRRFLSL